MSYTNEEILNALGYTSIGGGGNYTESEGKLHPSDADIEVSTVDGFLDALDSSNEIIAIANDVTLDLTGQNMLDLGSKTLVSYRGWNGQDGAILYSNSRGYYGSRPYTLLHSSESPRVTGLRIGGARFNEDFTRWDYDDNLARAIMLAGPGGEIDNCSIGGWTWSAIHLKGEGENTVTNAEVHHNHIHKAYQIGYGYGLDIWRGFGDIHHNYFDETRHAIVGFGWWNSGYIVENNIFGPRQYSHQVDMHCLEENNANSRAGDDQDDPDYDLRAGGEMVIRNNTFTADTNVNDGEMGAIAIRGVPWNGVWIENNRFVHSERPPYNSGNSQEGFAWRQVNLNLSSWDDIPQDDEGFTLNWNDGNNQYNAPDTAWEPGTGASVNIKNPENQVITIDGPPQTNYIFSVEGNVEKSTAYGASTNSHDNITTYDDSTTLVSGKVYGGTDSFDIDGEISSMSVDGTANVLIDDEEFDPAQISDTVITIEGRGPRVDYTFSVEGNVEKSTAYGASTNAHDDIITYDDFDTIVAGRVHGGIDSYVIYGGISSMSIDGTVDVLINSKEIDPTQFNETVITIQGRGTTTHYEFEYRGDVEKSTAYDATINSFDEIGSNTVTGRVTNEPDSYVFTGAITGFTADSPVDVSFNGQSTGLWF